MGFASAVVAGAGAVVAGAGAVVVGVSLVQAPARPTNITIVTKHTSNFILCLLAFIYFPPV
jgi:hypothetical protein